MTDPKELEALEAKIEELTQLKDKLEEEILLLMDKVEEEQKVVEEKRRQVEGLGKKVKDLEEHFRMDTERLTKQLEDLRARREQLRAAIDGKLLSDYERLKEKLGGVAMVAVEDGTCTGCRMAVPRDMIDAIRAGDRIVRCENCHRILWIPD
mgnify:CR=1 FL=1